MSSPRRDPRRTTPFDPNPQPEQVQVEQVVVTPDLARKWLTQNIHNRNLSTAVIDTLARQMREGKFPVNGDTIRFDINGVLLDGQHRLHAVAKAGVTVTMLVVYNLPPEVHVTIDQGRRRSASDALTLAGLPYSTAQSALASLALRVEDNVATGGTKHRPVNGEILDYVLAHPEVEEAASFATNLASKRGFRDAKQTVIGYSYMILSQIHETDAEDLWVAVADLMPLYQGDPALALARRLSELRRARARVTEPVMLDLIYRTWNKRRRTAQLLKLPMREVPNFGAVTKPI